MFPIKRKMPSSRSSLILTFFMVLILGLGVRFGLAATQLYPWSEGLYVYRGNNIPVEKVLKDFADQFGMRVILSPAVSGLFDGVAQAKSPTHFLNDLSNIYGFDWFYYDGALHISSSTERLTRIISIRKSNMRGVHDTIQSVGLLVERFGWSEVPEQDVVVVTGPGPYLDYVEGLVGRFNIAPKDTEIAVMRLRYGTASDLSIPYRNTTTVIPGVVTILNQLLQDGGVALPEAAKEKLTEKEMAALGHEGAKGLVSIQGDDRLNAVIIKAPKFLMGLYRSLVEKLDIPTSLIQIDVDIVDVSTKKASEISVPWTLDTKKLGIGYGQATGSEAAGTQGAGAARINLLDMSFGTSSLGFNAIQFLSRLKILEENGQAQTVSRPSILALDNTMAVYDSSRTFYILNSGIQTTSTKAVEAGLSVRVKPRLIRDDTGLFIQMWLEIQDGGFDEKKARVKDYPIVSKNAISTILMLKDGDSTLIAGEKYTHEEKSDGGIPYIKDIPVLGWLFNDKASAHDSRRRFYIITPHVNTHSDLLLNANGEALEARNKTLPDNLKVNSLEKAVQSVDPNWQYTPEKQELPPEKRAYLPNENATLSIRPQKQASYLGQLTPPSPRNIRRSSSSTVLTREDGALL